MSRLPALLLPLMLGGCPGEEPCTETNAPNWYQDADADGWSPSLEPIQACWAPSADWVPEVAAGLDCDDADPQVHPGAQERCDGRDDDCDGDVDEEVTSTFWLDVDDDGCGDAASPVQACEQPEGASASDDDCDDQDPAAHPGADEACDGADNDCDGEVDEGVTTTFYADLDGDGWGDDGAPTEACEPSEVLVGDAGDCDDGDPAVNPDAAEQWNGIDDDCDGQLDDLSVLEVASGLLEGDVEHQQAGAVLALGGDFVDGAVASSGDDFVVLGGLDEPCPLWALDGTAYGVEGTLGIAAATGDSFEGMLGLESIRGPMRDLVADEAGLEDWLLTATVYTYHAAVIFDRGALDVEYDMIWEEFVASFGDTTANDGLNSWAVDILHAPIGEEVRQPKVSAGGFPESEAPDTPWVAIGLDRYSDGDRGSECGAAALFRGPFGGALQHDDEGYNGADVTRVVGEGSQHRLGTDLLLADFDGLGGEDLLVGAADYPGTGDALGAVYLVDGTDITAIDGDGYLGEDVPYHVRVAGTVDGEQIGSLGNLVPPGDLNGNGQLDLALPSPSTNRVYVLLDPALREWAEIELCDDDLGDDDLFAFEADGVGFGAAVAASSDIDGDGYDDLVVGAPEAPGEDGVSPTGAVWVFSWARDAWASAEANGPNRSVLTLYGEHRSDRFGSSLAGGGDLDEDGHDDLLIGAPGWDARYALGYLGDEGRVYVLLGGEF